VQQRIIKLLNKKQMDVACSVSLLLAQTGSPIDQHRNSQSKNDWGADFFCYWELKILDTSSTARGVGTVISLLSQSIGKMFKSVWLLLAVHVAVHAHVQGILKFSQSENCDSVGDLDNAYNMVQKPPNTYFLVVCWMYQTYPIHWSLTPRAR